jgi:type II secretory pathway pseudopilin PulG
MYAAALPERVGRGSPTMNGSRPIEGSPDETLLPTGCCGRIRGAGFTYIGLLVFIAILGIGLAATGVVFHQQGKRGKEEELMFAGDQIRRAIIRYYERSPGQSLFPKTLEELLEDRRYPVPQRYLRRLYVDPMTGLPDWELVRSADGGIQGVHSKSRDKPLKTAGFPLDYEEFSDKKRYSDWQFIAPDPFPQHESPGIPPPVASRAAP